MHPDSGDSRAVTLDVDRDGLLVRPAGDTGAAGAAGEALRIGWAVLAGFDASDCDVASGLQVLEARTDDGVLTLLVAAPDVSTLLVAIGSWAERWRRVRRRSQSPVQSAAYAAARAAVQLATVWVARLRPLHRRLARTLAVLAMIAAARAVRARLHALAVAAVRHWAGWGRLARGATVGVAVIALVLPALVSLGSGPVASGANRPRTRTTAPTGNHALNSQLGSQLGSSMMSRMLGATRHPQLVSLPPATAPPAPAPPSVAAAPPLSSHEVFGFAPYWTLPQSGGFDVQGLTTIAYFSIDVNPNGTLDHSGSGWDGYQSQALADLVTRAHAAGDRVVLTVNQFDQGALDQLTSSPTAPATLSNQLIQAIEAKNLDGVNLDLEGNGPGDQAGLTNLVAQVSTALHTANPHWQVTMDTYASSAGDPAGFYDIPALAPHVDAFFVMAYELNLNAPAGPASPLTSAMFSDETSVEQYAAAVPPSKVIFGLPFYGYDWPTSDGTLNATNTGGATPVSYAQAVDGHPQYWDPVTDTAWTSYQVGQQWHEIFYEDSASLYMAAQLAQWFHFDGVGIWALGMEGGDETLLAALDGFAPPAKVGSSGPAVTSLSPTATTPTTKPTTATTVPPTTSTTAVPPTTTTTAGNVPVGTGQYMGQQVALNLLGVLPTGTPATAGTLTGFTTTVPSLSCLEGESALEVFTYASLPGELVVVTRRPADCTSGVLEFAVSEPPTTTTTTSTTTTTTTTPGGGAGG